MFCIPLRVLRGYRGRGLAKDRQGHERKKNCRLTRYSPGESITLEGYIVSVGDEIELDLLQVSQSDIDATPENDQITFTFTSTIHHLSAPASTCLVGSSHQSTISNLPDVDCAAGDVDPEFELNKLPEFQNDRTWLLFKRELDPAAFSSSPHPLLSTQCVLSWCVI